MRPLRYRRCVTVREYATGSFIVEWRPRLCYHSLNCVRALPLVFDKDRRGSTRRRTADEVEATVERCPSGRYRRLRGEPLPAPTRSRSAGPERPALVRGPITVVRPDGAVEEVPRAAFCRCGQSGNKPFCDGSHRDAGFKGMTVRDNELQRYEAIVDGELAGSLFLPSGRRHAHPRPYGGRGGVRGAGDRQPAHCGDARRHPRTKSADAAVLSLREGVPGAPSRVRRPDRRLEQSYIQTVMRRLLLPLLARALPARRRGDDAVGPTRHRRAGRPEGLPDRVAKGPPAEGFAEVAAAGVNVLKVGPAGGWTADDLARTIAENRAAAAHGLSTWVNLSAFAQLRPGGWRESLLRHVVGTLEADPSASAIALWKGADEPWRFRMRPASLRYGYCLATGRHRAGVRGVRRSTPAGSGSPSRRRVPASGRWRRTPRSPTSTASTATRSRSATRIPTWASPARGRTSSASPRRGARCGRRSGFAGRGATTRRETSSCQPGSSSAS